MSNAIAGNQNFTRIGNTVVSPSTLNTAQVDASQVQFKQVEGTFSPTSAQTYSVVDGNGDAIRLPSGVMPAYFILDNDSTTAFDGTTVVINLASTATGTETAQTGTITTANITLGSLTASTQLTRVASAAPYLSATTVGASTAGSKLRVRVLYF